MRSASIFSGQQEEQLWLLTWIPTGLKKYPGYADSFPNDSTIGFCAARIDQNRSFNLGHAKRSRLLCIPCSGGDGRGAGLRVRREPEANSFRGSRLTLRFPGAAQDFGVMCRGGGRGQIQRVRNQARQQQAGDGRRQLDAVPEKAIRHDGAGRTNGLVAEKTGCWVVSTPMRWWSMISMIST